MVLRHHHTKSNKSKMATPTTTPTETKPISLELFNHAAANLDAKDEIQLREYQKLFVQQKLKESWKLQFNLP